MKIEIATPETLVERYDVDKPITASDAELLESAAPLAPTSAERRHGKPFVLSRDFEGLEMLAEALAFGRQAEESAKAFVLTPESYAVSEYELAQRLGVDRSTIRRWRGKDGSR